jgi:hypothetical protein
MAMEKQPINQQIMGCNTFGDLLKVLEANYDTNFQIPFILKFGMSSQLPNLLKPFKRGK